MVEPGSTVGTPWGAVRYRAELGLLRAALVPPYRQRFLLAETHAHAIAAERPLATYWVVAATDDTLVWLDEATGEFGLATPAAGAALPVSIGVRGDLVGSFCAR